MTALSIAFDTIIVGVLALPWVVFAVDLFFLKDAADDFRVKKLLDEMTQRVQPVVAGVMLFAVTYLLGSAISRTAQDFFNDSDLSRFWVTEDNIRTAEYCDQRLETPGTSENNPPGETFRIIPGQFDMLCSTRSTSPENRKQWVCHHLLGNLCDNYTSDAVSRTVQVFRLQEGAVLQNGEDKAERLRQLHNQISVLRGAAFNGVIASVFCLFGWCARQTGKTQRAKTQDGKTQWVWLVPGAFFVFGLCMLYLHFQHNAINAPPFVELTFTLLGVLGCVALRKGEDRRWYGFVLLVSLMLLTGVAYLGWWSTEVLYDREVIYRFYALSHAPLK